MSLFRRPLSGPVIWRWVLLLGLVSWFARFALALQGGQLFLGDESRYLRGVALYQAVAHGQAEEIRWLLSQPDHPLFVWLSSLVAPLQHGFAALAGHGDWTIPANRLVGLPLAAGLLSLASAAIIPATYLLARRAGADATSAGWAAVLAAGSNTLFFISRHLQPYDAAVLLWLWALTLGCGENKRAWFAGGFLAALNFYLYAGYWFLVPLAAGWLLWRQRTAGSLARWTAGAALGGCIPAAIGFWNGGVYYWRFLLWFGHTVKQGLFAEGWSLPAEFFWHAEGWAGLGLVALITATLWLRRKCIPAYAAAILGLLLCAYALMVLGSVGLEKFVVYGRTCRPLVPLLCIAGGWAVAAVLADNRRLHLASLAAVAVVTLHSFAPHYRRVFPREWEARIEAAYGHPKHALSVTGIMYGRPAQPVDRPDLALCNAAYLYPIRTYVGCPAGRILLRVPHPLSYPPYQYEGHTPRERRLLRAHDIALTLVSLETPADVPDFPRREQLFGEDVRGDGYDRGRPQD